MAPKYRKIDPRIWRDEKFRRLTPTEKLITLYTLTNEQTNRIGLFAQSPALASEQIGIDADTYAIGIDRVCDTLGWGIDRIVSVVFIPNWWRYNGRCGPKRMRGYLTDIHDIPQTMLIQEFASNTSHLSPAEKKVLDTYGIRIGGVCPVRAQEQEQEQEQEQDINSCANAPEKKKAKQPKNDYSEAFLKFWEAYPRKLGKANAEKAFIKAAKTTDPEYIIEAAVEFADSPAGQRGTFTAHPATWLNGERYNDDREEWKRDGECVQRPHEKAPLRRNDYSSFGESQVIDEDQSQAGIDG